MNTAEHSGNDIEVSRQNMHYYNAIAAEYDSILSADLTNDIIRQKVAEAFISSVKKGTVLDFGGGTGQDLPWLINHAYKVVFCEPSEDMRKIAIGKCETAFTNDAVLFLNQDATDFRKWSAIFPFQHRVDAVLANFAVINCIRDIALLFQQLAMIVRPQGTVMILMLDNALKNNMRTKIKFTMQSLFWNEPMGMSVGYHNQYHQVYLHSTKTISSAVSGYFEIHKIEKIQQTGFSLLHLIRQ